MVRLIGTSDAALDAAVSDLLAARGAPPGVCVATSVAGELRWAAGGVAQAFRSDGPLPDPPLMDLNTRSDIGSLTKIAATTAALMALVHSGQLDLAARLDAVLPWLARSPVGSATVAAVLQHRAGLWEWWPTYLEPGDPLHVVAALPLRYPPDDGRHYSDLGFMLLGAVVATVAGQPLTEAVSRLALGPMGMEATAYAGPVPGGEVAASSLGDRIERDMVASGRPYPVTAEGAGFPWREHVLVGEVNDGNAFHSFNSVAGHAGLFATAADLLKFCDGLLDCLSGRGHLSGAVVRRFLTPGSDPMQACGFRLWHIGPMTAFGHTGFPGVAMAVIPKRRTSVVLVTNRLHVTGAPAATEEMWTEVLTAVGAQGTSAWQ